MNIKIVSLMRSRKAFYHDQKNTALIVILHMCNALVKLLILKLGSVAPSVIKLIFGSNRTLKSSKNVTGSSYGLQSIAPSAAWRNFQVTALPSLRELKITGFKKFLLSPLNFICSNILFWTPPIFTKTDA